MSHDFFSSRPPVEERKVNFPVIRSSKKWGLQLAGLCLSDRVLCAPTHFKGRSVPCLAHLGKKCDFCENGIKPRWVGYLAILHKGRKVKGMLELTHLAADQTAKFAEEKGSLRGWVIVVSRLNDRANGILQVKFEHSNLDPEQIPPGFSVTEALSHMWKLNRHLLEAEDVQRGISLEELEQRGQLNEDVYHSNGRATA